MKVGRITQLTSDEQAMLKAGTDLTNDFLKRHGIPNTADKPAVVLKATVTRDDVKHDGKRYEVTISVESGDHPAKSKKFPDAEQAFEYLSDELRSWYRFD